MLDLLLSLFILTPLALLQTAAGSMFFASIFKPELVGDMAWLWAIGLGLAIIILNRIVDAIRFGLGGTGNNEDILFWILDIPMAVLRLPLQIITDVCCILALFGIVDLSVHYAATFEYDGFVNVFLSHYLQIRVDSSAHWERRKQNERNREREATPSIDATEYKWQNFRYQLKLWIFTVLHSLPFILVMAIYGLDHAFWYIDDPWSGIVQLVLIVALVLIYGYFGIGSAVYKGINVDVGYYEDTRITRVTYEESLIFNELVRNEKVIQEEGWKTIISFPTIIYLVFAGIMFIPQTIALIISLVVPPYSAILPCRNCDVSKSQLGFLDRITLFLFGFIRNN